MAKLDIYDVVVNGHPTQMQLTEDDAKFYGGTKVEAGDDEAAMQKQAPARQNKARGASNKAAAPTSGKDAAGQAHEGEAGAE